MGLDMFLYKMRKLTDAEAQVVRGKKVENIRDMGYMCFHEDDVISNKPMFSSIKKYLTKTKVIYSFVNVQKIREDYDIPDEAHIGMESYHSGGVTFGFRCYDMNERGDFKKDVDLTDSEYESYIYDTEENAYVVAYEEAMYWRKNYKLQNAIYNSFTREIENCGYYALTKKAKAVIEKDSDKALPETDDNEVLVYHEWY